jgi:CubicO group peptidase (beta-lactamase class C family)
LERGWTPGEKAGYHLFTSWYILGELVRRYDGRPFSDYVRQEIFLPLGMRDSWIGMTNDAIARYADRLGSMPLTEKSPAAAHRYDSPAGMTACIPGGNARGPMHDLGRFYQMLLGGGQLDGARVLSSASVEQMTTPQRVGMYDETFKHVMDWGLGLIIDSNRYGAATVPYGYGRHASPRTFGHGGSQSSTGFADPERKLVVAAVFAGMPGDRQHDARMRAFVEAVYEDLGLAAAG